MKTLICLLLAATLAACSTTGGSTLTDEQKAFQQREVFRFAVGRVRAGMATGLINIRASKTEIFAADTACSALILAAVMSEGSEIPFDVVVFCQEITTLLRAGDVA